MFRNGAIVSVCVCVHRGCAVFINAAVVSVLCVCVCVCVCTEDVCTSSTVQECMHRCWLSVWVGVYVTVHACAHF